MFQVGRLPPADYKIQNEPTNCYKSRTPTGPNSLTVAVRLRDKVTRQASSIPAPPPPQADRKNAKRTHDHSQVNLGFRAVLILQAKLGANRAAFFTALKMDKIRGRCAVIEKGCLNY
jgi:hypothetical protein